MSYKHNNLLAMREQYWQDQSEQAMQEKFALQQLLQQYEVFTRPNLDDTRYVFFHLPSQIIIQGYALGFVHQQVQALVVHFLQERKLQLQQKLPFPVQYRYSIST